MSVTNSPTRREASNKGKGKGDTARTADVPSQLPTMTRRSRRGSKSVYKSSQGKKTSTIQKVTVDKPLNSKTDHYEFGGPLGALAMVTLLPLLVLLFAFGCNESGYVPLHRGYNLIYDVVHSNYGLDDLLNVISSWNILTFLCYLIFLAHLITFTITMPGEEVDGTELRDGTRLKYRLNGLSVLQTTITMILMTTRGFGLLFPLWIANNFAQFALASLLISYLVSIIVFVSSFYGRKLLALGGNTGNSLYDFTIGRELNPRIGKFDMKFFTELRPGLIAWLLLNGCMLLKQYHKLGRITNSMILINLFQGLYIVDALWNESSILSTMDITTDGFGFMLAFGNFCWVPMMYSLQARYLADFPVDLSYVMVAVILGLEVGGFYIFRSANSQKDTFRQRPSDPKNKDLTYITTETGSRLITSGWWGRSRHINYLGDWMMALSWCMTCGFSSWVPYFYCIYFAILLVHRERRDEAKCRHKYGKDWDRYCGQVPYRIIPYIY